MPQKKRNKRINLRGKYAKSKYFMINLKPGKK
jgi:hypothetical protein